MSLSVYNIKKWAWMLSGKDVLHAQQPIGRCYSPNAVEGYFNDLSEKVLRQPELLESDQLPTCLTESGEWVEFPVAIFQYGLGAYDLYLSSGNSVYANKFYQCADWAICHQEEKGSWNNFFFVYPDEPYGAMCQGEAASLLVRAYKETGNEGYLEAARRALDFMITDIHSGGTSTMEESGLLLHEYTGEPLVLNGWIFSLFGLHDYCCIDPTPEFSTAYELTLKALKSYLPQFDNGYWSLYDISGKIASPFYHQLHIAQLDALYETTKDEVFLTTMKKWARYSEMKTNSIRAFVLKAIQKIKD